LLLPEKQPVAARKQWLAGQLKARGQLVIDDGAVRVLENSGRSLLPVGVTAVTGIFDRGDVVTIVDAQGREVARGLVNYDSKEASQLQGCSSDRIAELLGYAGEQEMIHRDNMVMVD
jgi:glutamate 5-kinase